MADSSTPSIQTVKNDGIGGASAESVCYTAGTPLGTRRVDCAHHPEPSSAWPIRIQAGAFAEGIPARGLTADCTTRHCWATAFMGLKMASGIVGREIAYGCQLEFSS